MSRQSLFVFSYFLNLGMTIAEIFVLYLLDKCNRHLGYSEIISSRVHTWTFRSILTVCWRCKTGIRKTRIRFFNNYSIGRKEARFIQFHLTEHTSCLWINVKLAKEYERNHKAKSEWHRRIYSCEYCIVYTHCLVILLKKPIYCYSLGLARWTLDCTFSIPHRVWLEWVATKGWNRLFHILKLASFNKENQSSQ